MTDNSARCPDQSNDREKVRISVVTTMYYSAPYLKEFYERMIRALRQITDDYEMIFVNDGSPDESLNIALRLREGDARVSVVDLSRNFGHHRAVMAGLSFCKGELVFLINCDLEEDPENLVSFYEAITGDADCDAVFGVREKRQGEPLTILFAKFFYALLNFLSHERFDPSIAFSRIMRQQYARSLLEFTERDLYLLGIFTIIGYNQKPLRIQARYKGSSSYTFHKKISLAVTAITSFSSNPLTIIFYFGVFMSFFSILGAIFLVADKIIYGTTLLGWTSLMVSVWLVGGISITMLGIIGAYLARMFEEIKGRPRVIVRQVFTKTGKAS